MRPKANSHLVRNDGYYKTNWRYKRQTSKKNRQSARLEICNAIREQ